MGAGGQWHERRTIRGQDGKANTVKHAEHMHYGVSDLGDSRRAMGGGGLQMIFVAGLLRSLNRLFAEVIRVT